MKIVQIIDSSQFEQPVSMDGACSCLKEEMAQRRERSLSGRGFLIFFYLLSWRENFLLRIQLFIKIELEEFKSRSTLPGFPTLGSSANGAALVNNEAHGCLFALQFHWSITDLTENVKQTYCMRVSCDCICVL